MDAFVGEFLRSREGFGGHDSGGDNHDAGTAVNGPVAEAVAAGEDVASQDVFAMTLEGCCEGALVDRSGG